MPSLRETQAAFRDALLGGDAQRALANIAGDGLAPEARLAIYRHHVGTTLTDLLTAVYPVVARLVDARFFGYVADRFIAAHPPSSPCLVEYGAAFGEFLAAFAPCRPLPYLPDVARLEWAISRAADADEAAPLDPRLLRDLPPRDLDPLTFRFHPSLTLIASPWPIARIWRANQEGADPHAIVDLGSGPSQLQVWRREDGVCVRALSPAAAALRRALLDGASLGAAARTGWSLEPGFDLTAALHALLTEDALVAFTSNEEDCS